MRVFFAVLLTTGVALANSGPPPAPEGKKYVDVNCEVQLDKGVSGYVLYEEGWRLDFNGPLVFPLRKVEATAEKPTAIPAEATRRWTILYAVPESVVKEYKTEAELAKVIGTEKVKGVRSIRLAGFKSVDRKRKGDSVTWTYTITSIDEKDGIKVKIAGDGYEEPKEKDEKPAKPITAEPGVWVGGAFAALTITLGGLWLVRRRR